MISQVTTKLYTVEEYLAFERASETKHEFDNGEIIPMTGASRKHNLIVTAILGELYAQAKDTDLEVYPSDIRVRVPSTGKYTYPDVAVAKDEPAFEDDEFDTLLNARLLIEVLSETTANYDRGDKFENYRSIESLTDYLLVAQDRVHIEYYARQLDGSWVYREYKELSDCITLDSISCTLNLADVYRKVLRLLSSNGSSS